MVDAGGGSEATEHVQRSPEAPTTNINKEDGIVFCTNEVNMLPSETIVQLCSK